MRHVATPAEYASVGVGRIGPLRFARSSIERYRNVILDRAVADGLRRTDLALITASAAALRSLRRARSIPVPSYLNYPSAHHCFVEALVTEENARCPEYAETMPPKDPDWLKQKLSEELKLATRIFVMSTFQQRTFVDCGVDEGKFVVAPLGVDLDLFRPRPRADDGVFRIAFVAMITQRKGLSYLIDAFDRAALPNSELFMVGSVVGTGKPWWGHPGIRRVPAVPRWELPSLYATADVYVVPSLMEGFLLTALEAMACGLPVIISENTFGRDVVHDGVDGYVVPIRDADAIAERLRYLYDRPEERRRIGAAARRRAEDFSWERYEEHVVAAVTSQGR